MFTKCPYCCISLDDWLIVGVPQCASTLLQVLQAQEDAVQSVQQEARDALLAIAGNKKQYQTLLTDLLVCLCFDI